MTAARVSGRRVEAGLVGLGGAMGFGEGSGDFQDGVFGAAVAVFFVVFAADDGDGVEDVSRVIVVQTVEMEDASTHKRCCQFSACAQEGAER